MKITSIPYAFKLIWGSKLIWRSPAKAKVLFFDREGLGDFCEYLDMDCVHVLDTRGESFNVWAVLMTLARCGFRATMSEYCVTYARLVQPDLALTFIDNTKTFYELKRSLPGLIAVAIQNGWRDNVLFETLKVDGKKNPLLSADFILCFGKAIGQKYLESIDAGIIAIGSFNNNKVFNGPGLKKVGSVAFLSQYREPVDYGNGPVMPIGSRGFPWGEFYSAEKFILPLLMQYTQRHGLELKILGCSRNKMESERAFFEEILGEYGWQFSPREEHLGSYRRVIEANYIVSLDSTLGIESVGRGGRVGLFSVRGTYLSTTDRSYGWEAGFPPEGHFWTSQLDAAEVQRVMDFVVNASDSEWAQARNAYVAEIIEYDPGNSKFRQLMSDLGVPLKGEMRSDVQ